MNSDRIKKIVIRTNFIGTSEEVVDFMEHHTSITKGKFRILQHGPGAYLVEGDIEEQYFTDANYNKDWTIYGNLDEIQDKSINKEMLEALQDAKTIIYNLSNGLEKRNPIELQAMFDTLIKKATE